MADTSTGPGPTPISIAVPHGSPPALTAAVISVECGAHWQAGCREVRVFRGHTYSVWAVAYHPDGTLVASGSDDRCIRVWKVNTGQVVRILRGHTESVRCLAFSRDGRLLASGSTDRTIRLWNAGTGGFLRELCGRYDQAVHSISFSPDGLMLARCTQNRDIKIWEVSTAQELLSLLPSDEYDPHWNICAVFSPDGRYLAAGNDIGALTLFEVFPNAQVICQLEGHKPKPPEETAEQRGSGAESQEEREDPFEHRIGALAFSPDGTTLVSGSRDKTIKFWEIPSGQLIRTVGAHDGWVRAVTFSPDGKVLASCSDDTTIKLWDPSTGGLIRILQGHKEPVRSITFSPDGRRLVSGSHDKTARLWEGGAG
jgi:WD40 repeat protein